MKKTFSILFLLLLSGCTNDFGRDGSNTTLIIFHNNMGAMCIAELEWLDSIKTEYPNLIIEEYLTTTESGRELLNEKISGFNESEGYSNSFYYLPITFFKGRAFSGFDEEVKDLILEELNTP